ncbi:hypothetical protein IFM89_013998 [Coptis chinensis]|uniref:cellulase n=1 Tax=Coptis chinensis TaxID=261450 RepID=A0A835IS77_9MAGN|nr:hypothetical protein IFM89_013998 [Coptis chinensis]
MAASGFTGCRLLQVLVSPVQTYYNSIMGYGDELRGRFLALPCNRGKFISQADYVLGNNAMEMSNLIGYGNKYPEYVHHRGASIPANAKIVCKGFKWLESTEPNPNVAVGALVGGPFLNESYIDSRNNSMQGVPTTYNSDVIAGLLSSLVTTSSVCVFHVGTSIGSAFRDERKDK